MDPESQTIEGSWSPRARSIKSTDDELRQWIENEESILLKEIGINPNDRPSLSLLRDNSPIHSMTTKSWKLSKKASLKIKRKVTMLESATGSSESVEPTVVQHAPQKPLSRDSKDAVSFPGPARQQQDLELLPGSVYLVDSDGSILKLPIPSDDPNDPLQWSKWKRTGALFCIIFFQTLGLSMVQLPEVNYRLLQADPALANNGSLFLEQLTVFPTLFVGIGAFIWTPLSVAIGRRPVFLICIFLLTIGAVVAGTAKDFNTLLGAVSFQGLAAAPIWSLMLLMVCDMTFIHERPQALSAYWSLGGAAILVALTIVTQLTSRVFHNNWRSVYWVWTVLCVLCFIASYFLLPESYFVRPAVAYNGKVLIQSGGEKVHIYEDWQVQRRSESKASSAHQKTWGNLNSWKDAGACFPQILLCLANPLVFWVLLLNTLNFAGLISIAGTYPSLLSADPYDLQPDELGMVSLAAAGGAVLAWPTCGLLISKCIHGMARRNRGVRHAEYYLPAFILPVLAGVMGLILYGVGAQKKLDRAFVYISYALYMFNFEGSSVASTLWVTEAFPQWATSALIVVGGMSYVLSFGVSFALPHILELHGYAAANIGFAAGILVLGVVAVPIAFWGKGVRQYGTSPLSSRCRLWKYLHGRWGAYEGGALRPQR